MGENLLDIENLSVVYRTDDASIYSVNGVDMSVKNGETLGLVGEMGAGKTTAALAIMKLLPERIGIVKSGKITLAGIDITRATEH